MAQVTGVKHVELKDDTSHEIDIDVDDDTSNGAAPTPLGSGLGTSSVRGRIHMARSSKTVKILTAIVSVLGIVAVSVALTAHYVRATSSSTGTSTSDSDNDGDTIAAHAEAFDPHPFLKVDFATDGGTTMFALHKDHWNESFMVYPIVERHSAPPSGGMERGSILLETSDNVFHFEKSFDPRFLILVQEIHRTRLASDDDELKQVFEDSQWPGYIASVAIIMETDDIYYFAIDPLISSGFFVSTVLMTSFYKPIEEGSAFYPRNTMLQVEYELMDGIAIVSYVIGLLPEQPMKERAADDRVGYFTKRYTRYGVDSDNLSNVSVDEDFHYMDPAMTVIHRRRLELNPATNQTKDPITYYIDPSVPKRWRKAFAAGVEAWSPAFEKIGFKDAIKAVLPGDKDWPEDYHLGDIRYSSISVMISSETYAIGQSVIDPRSGEIVQSQIMFEYGFFDEVIGDFNLRSPVDPPTYTTGSTRHTHTKMKGQFRQCDIALHPHHQIDRGVMAMLTEDENGYIPDELIARHFTDIVMHEVGHTLGLRHNFAGSAAYSRNQLDDDNFVDTNSLSSSIMDYVPVNIYSDLTKIEATKHGYYSTRIGAYDYAAIAYGYSIVDDEVPGYKSKKLTALAQATPLFLTDEDADMMTNPYSQRFDLSSDPIDYANDRLELIVALRNGSLLSKLPDDTSWSTLWRREFTLMKLMLITMEYVHPFLGGVNVTHAHYHQGETHYSPNYVPKADQERALAVLTRIISADDGLFPDPSEYSTYVKVEGMEDEDCDAPSLDYSCLGRGLINLDKVILYIRQQAILMSLVPSMERIIAQDVNSPLTLVELLTAVETAVSTNSSLPRNQAVQSAFFEVLQNFVDDPETDSRIKSAIEKKYPSVTPRPTMAPAHSQDDSREY